MKKNDIIIRKDDYFLTISGYLYKFTQNSEDLKDLKDIIRFHRSLPLKGDKNCFKNNIEYDESKYNHQYFKENSKDHKSEQYNSYTLNSVIDNIMKKNWKLYSQLNEMYPIF